MDPNLSLSARLILVGFSVAFLLLFPPFWTVLPQERGRLSRTTRRIPKGTKYLIIVTFGIAVYTLMFPDENLKFADDGSRSTRTSPRQLAPMDEATKDIEELFAFAGANEDLRATEFRFTKEDLYGSGTKDLIANISLLPSRG